MLGARPNGPGGSLGAMGKKMGKLNKKLEELAKEELSYKRL